MPRKLTVKSRKPREKSTKKRVNKVSKKILKVVKKKSRVQSRKVSKVIKKKSRVVSKKKQTTKSKKVLKQRQGPKQKRKASEIEERSITIKDALKEYMSNLATYTRENTEVFSINKDEPIYCNNKKYSVYVIKYTVDVNPSILSKKSFEKQLELIKNQTINRDISRFISKNNTNTIPKAPIILIYKMIIKVGNSVKEYTYETDDRVLEVECKEVDKFINLYKYKDFDCNDALLQKIYNSNIGPVFNITELFKKLLGSRYSAKNVSELINNTAKPESVELLTNYVIKNVDREEVSEQTVINAIGSLINPNYTEYSDLVRDLAVINDDIQTLQKNLQGKLKPKERQEYEEKLQETIKEKKESEERIKELSPGINLRDIQRSANEILSEIKSVNEIIDVNKITERRLNKTIYQEFSLNPIFLKNIPQKSLQLDSNLIRSINDETVKYYIVRTEGRGKVGHNAAILEDSSTGKLYSFGFGPIEEEDIEKERKITEEEERTAPYSYIAAGVASTARSVSKIPGVTKIPFLRDFTDLQYFTKLQRGDFSTPDTSIKYKLKSHGEKYFSSINPLTFVRIIDFGKFTLQHGERLQKYLDATINISIIPLLKYNPRDRKFFLEFDFGYIGSGFNLIIPGAVYRQGISYYNPDQFAGCSASNPANCTTVIEYVFNDKIDCKRLSGFYDPFACKRRDGKQPNCKNIGLKDPNDFEMRFDELLAENKYDYQDKRHITDSREGRSFYIPGMMYPQEY